VRIVVPVKQVAALDDEFELTDDGVGVDPDFLEWDLNEWDAFSLEAAVALREAGGDGDGEVIAVTVGDEEAEEGLLACLAKGADRAVRIWDDDLEGADTLAVARVLAAAVGRESPGLVLCGVQSSDAVNGATGVALAAFLDLPHVAVVKRLEVGDGSAEVDRELEGGLLETLRVALPAVLTIQTGINAPRYATLRQIKQAKAKPLDLVGLDDLGLVAGDLEAVAGSRRRRLAVPSSEGGAEMLSGSPAEVADRIAQIVGERMGS